MTSIFLSIILLLGFFEGAKGLKIHNSTRLATKQPEFDLSGITWKASSTQLNSTISTITDIADAASEGDYCGCSESSCFINSAKVKSTFQNQLILILGCSLDINAIGYFCSASTGVPMESVVMSSPFSYLAHCDVGQFTIAYAFHPGASPPPYNPAYNQALLGSSVDIVSRTKSDVVTKFGREPVAVVVDASLWDVGNWYNKAGSPPYPYAIPDAFMQQWCTKDLPAFLKHVHNVYPNSHVAFRNAPTIFANPNSYGLSALEVEKMVACLELSKDSFGKLFGSFAYIDFHHMVDVTLQTSGSGASAWYKDSLHPGPQLSLMYINNVLAWVNQFVMDLKT